MNRQTFRSAQAGFSLIELAMVLFIVGLLVTGLLGPLATQVEQRERQQTKDVLEDIEESLFGHAISTGRLICPDCTDNTANCAAVTANDGQEDLFGAAGSRNCATQIGNLPWVDLGVKELDPWGRRYMYRVTDNFADETDGSLPLTGTCSQTTGVSFQLCSSADITVRDKPAAGCVAGPGGAVVANNIPALVFSQGKKRNADTPLSCYEEENTNDTDAVFVSTDYSRHEGADPADPDLNYYYDDIVVWISPHILMNRMVNAGRLP